MQIKILAKRTVPIIILLGLILFVVLILYFISKNLTQSNPALLVENDTTTSNPQQINNELFLRLKIPSIGVDSPVISVGLTSDGAMDTPKGPAEVAWFNLGPRPGENGSAVMAGHYGWKDNLPAAFDDLHKLRVGDKIFTEDEKGSSATFIVREIRTYDKDAVASDVFASTDGKAHLNLITCTGTWNKIEKTRSNRLVVFTDKE